MNLTPSEQRVVEFVMDGMSNAEIATRLGINEKTVKHYLTNVYAKERVQSRAQLIVKKMRDAVTPSTDEIKAFREILK